MNSLEGMIIFTSGGGGINIASLKDVQRTVRNIFREHILALEPTFSPDGSQILFTKENPRGWPLSESPPYELMIIDREGNNFNKVLDIGKILCGYPSWSPDGTKIAFLAGKFIYNPAPDEGQVSELFISSIDGSGVRKVTDIPVFVSRPSWMPDSKRIVFASKNGKIYSINYDGTDLREITKGFSPSVSPDGKKIAFRDSRNIYVCDIEGKNKKMLVWNYDRVIFRSDFRDYGYPTELVWSPDGKHLLYSRSAWGIFSDMVVISLSNPFKRVKLNYVPGGVIRGMSWTI